MAISGHKSLSAFDRYDIVAERDIHEAGARMEHYFDHQYGENPVKAEKGVSVEGVRGRLTN